MTGRQVTSAAIVVPCHNEAETLPALLDALLPMVADHDRWELVLVNDASTDATEAIIADRIGGADRVRLISGRWRSPGAARTVGANSVTLLRPGSTIEWIVTIDADVTLPPGWLADWQTAIDAAGPDTGALSGGMSDAAAMAPFPHARKVGEVYGAVAGWGESHVGIVNITGSNHAISTEAYLTSGPYRQPTVVGPDGEQNLAGEDWDLGVRIRQHGFDIESAGPVVDSLGRRFHHDVRAFLDGRAYEGVFAPVAMTDTAADIDADEVDHYRALTLRRTLLHYYFKPLLAMPHLIDDQAMLGDGLREEMSAYVRRHPGPTIDESRNGFIYGRLARFADRFTDAVIAASGLSDRRSPSTA